MTKQGYLRHCSY